MSVRSTTIVLAALFAMTLLHAQAASATPAPALRVMTYNVNYANHDEAGTLDAIAQGDADVVLLQEITDRWRSALRARFAKSHPHQAYRLHTWGAGGAAVLSRIPIRTEELWSPPPRTGAYFPAQRIVLDAPGGPLQLLNVHLRPAIDGGSWVKGFLTTPPYRRREIEAHWKQLDAKLPTIIAGDFNEDDTGRAIDFLQGHGLQRVATSGPRTWRYEAEVKGQATELLKMDIDHVLIDGHFTASGGRVLDAGGSDHRPVVVTIQRK